MARETLWLHRCERCGTEEKFFYAVGEERSAPLNCRTCYERIDHAYTLAETMKPIRKLGTHSLARKAHHDGNDNRWRPGDPGDATSASALPGSAAAVPMPEFSAGMRVLLNWAAFLLVIGVGALVAWCMR